MSAADLIGALLIGLAAGFSSGMLGIGGGVLFVPGLVIFLDQSQLEGEATSLLAVVIVAGVGAWRQRSYGNLRLRDALLIGALSPLGVAVGVIVANAVPERALELSFAAVQLYFAYHLARRAAGRELDGGSSHSAP
jgi:uncharacterized membrane protein YfcA